MRRTYARFLPDLATRADLNRVIRWMCSEPAVGHHRVGGGDDPGEAERVPGGLLGADCEVVDGRYRFARVFGGLDRNPDLRSPLTEPGVDVRAGEYLLAVDGGTVTAANLAIWIEDAGWVVENEGVPPDIEVEQLPADVIAGRDPQLEKAIEVVMSQLPPSPPPRPTRPPCPVRVRP